MKYSININLKGYKNVELGKNGLENETVVVYIDKSCEDEKVQYYTYVKELLRNSNKLILIYKEDGNSIYKLLSMLMCMFGQYSIYKDTGFINSDYIDVLLEREEGHRCSARLQHERRRRHQAHLRPLAASSGRRL